MSACTIPPSSSIYLPDVLAATRAGLRVAPFGAHNLPLQHGWRDKATRDVEQVVALAARYPAAHWVAPMHQGQVALDIAGRDGLAELRSLEDRFGPLPTTIAVMTPRTTLLPIFTVEELEHDLLDLELTPSVCLRAGRRSVPVPPAPHRNGEAYTWAVAPRVAPLAPLPAAWTAHLAALSRPVRPGARIFVRRGAEQVGSMTGAT